jgi:hypothetical protein
VEMAVLSDPSRKLRVKIEVKLHNFLPSRLKLDIRRICTPFFCRAGSGSVRLWRSPLLESCSVRGIFEAVIPRRLLTIFWLAATGAHRERLHQLRLDLGRLISPSQKSCHSDRQPEQK